jgi:4-amino-4-deoxy-L-arabinose transferase-like glycosyltransferase
MPGARNQPENHRKLLWRAVVISFCLQVAAIGILHTYRFRITDNNFAFGWEMGCIGRAIASGRGFSDPFCIGAGPSAWEPPLYPYLIGAAFKLFGIYSSAAAWALLVINSLFSALTCIPVYWIARKMAGEKVARWSAWTWALLPYAWYWAIHWVWDTTISPLVLSLIILVALVMEECAGLRWWALFGLLWGMAALLNPALVAFLPFCGLWLWRSRHKRGLTSIGGVALASIVFFVCLAPWLVRNYRTFGLFIFVRDNLSQELWLGNGESATGISRVYLMPNRNAAELEKLREMGELPYLEEHKREALAFMREHPGQFAVLSIKRFFFYWAGVPRPEEGIALGVLRISLFLASSVLAVWGMIHAVRRRIPGAWLLVLLVLSYPLIYYLIYPHARYRHSIEPEMVIMIVFLVAEMTAGKVRSAGPDAAM